MKRLLTVIAAGASAAAMLVSCASAPERVTRAFALPAVPSVYSDPDDVIEYMCGHFWDNLLAVPSDGTLYLCDSSHVAGVDSKALLAHAVEYVGWLERNPSRQAAGRSLRDLVAKMERCMAADTASNIFPELPKMLEECLYNANSPIRDEDLYQPLADALAGSPMTPDNLRASYRYQSRMCLLNQEGSPAADFTFTDASGRRRSLYDCCKTPYTVLLFVNPGCHACGDVVQAFGDERTARAVGAGKLTVVSVYIDPEIDEWKSHVSEMPPFWINGYDQDGVIRQDLIYNVRAIPSVYLLDAGHTVLRKDTPPEEVLSVIFPEAG